MAPGQSVSLVARTYGVAPNLLYRWRKQMSEGGKTAIEANDEVVSVAEVQALKNESVSWSVFSATKHWKWKSSRKLFALAAKKNSSRGCPCPAWRISSETGHRRPGGVPIQHL